MIEDGDLGAVTDVPRKQAIRCAIRKQRRSGLERECRNLRAGRVELLAEIICPNWTAHLVLDAVDNAQALCSERTFVPDRYYPGVRIAAVAIDANVDGLGCLQRRSIGCTRRLGRQRRPASDKN